MYSIQESLLKMHLFHQKLYNSKLYGYGHVGEFCLWGLQK